MEKETYKKAKEILDKFDVVSEVCGCKQEQCTCRCVVIINAEDFHFTCRCRRHYISRSKNQFIVWIKRLAKQFCADMVLEVNIFGTIPPNQGAE